MTRSRDEVEKIISKLGYIFLEEYYADFKHRRVVIKDKSGYVYDTSLGHITEGHIPSIVSTRNSIVSLNNISLWLKLNNKQFELCKDNTYRGATKKLNFYHSACEEIFEMSWNKMLSYSGSCPVCSGHQIGEKTSLAYLRPDLAREWHTENKLRADEVTCGSGIKAFWVCSNCGYGRNKEWSAVIGSRVSGCGCSACKMSGGEKRISYWLTKNNIRYIFQYSPKDLVSKQGRPLEYDFALLDNRNMIVCIVEFDDLQHYMFVPFFHKTKTGFKNSKERDDLKNKYADANNIPLIRITSKKYNHIESILNKDVLHITADLVRKL